MIVELRHIRYFIVLAEELNFSRAAERLHISQPPLSRQIKELEEEIGARLFHRTKRYVALTNAGEVFLKKAYQILDQVDQACTAARAMESKEELVIGFTGTAQDIVPAIHTYTDLYPSVSIVLQQMTTAEQIKALHEKKIDIGLVTSPIHNEEIKTKFLKRCPFMLVMPKSHPLAFKPSLYMHELEQESFIMTTRSAGALYYDRFIEIFQNAGFKPNITIHAHDLHTVLTLVSAGLGITLTPSTIQPYSEVISKKVEDLTLSIAIFVAWRQQNQAVALKKFLSFLTKYIVM